MTALVLLFALASLTPDEILQKADRAASNYTDLRFTMTMTIEDGASKKLAKLETFDKGGVKRLVRFLSPGDVKGMAVLLDGPSSMYIYLPQFQKVRRVAGHAKQQGFMDSDFSHDDMGVARFTGLYTPLLLGETDKTYKLKLSPTAESAYEALELSIDKETFITTQIDYIQGGKAVKRQTRGEPKRLNDSYLSPTVITMEDLTRAHKTTLVMEDLKVNSNLPDSLFTKQNLERAR